MIAWKFYTATVGKSSTALLVFSNRPVKKTSEEPPVAYVIAEPCIGVKDNSCVEVCPVDCIHPTPDEPEYDQVDQLYIDPEECIDCDACVEACPVDAIFAEDQLPEEWAGFTELNAAYFRRQAA
jgi:NAD-dependent dihydropyrimidine dehydrogenase PreA subunit